MESNEQPKTAPTDEEVYKEALDRMGSQGITNWFQGYKRTEGITEIGPVPSAVEGTALMMLIKCMGASAPEESKEIAMQALETMVLFGVAIGEEAERVRRGEPARVDSDPAKTEEFMKTATAKVLAETLKDGIQACRANSGDSAPFMRKGEC